MTSAKLSPDVRSKLVNRTKELFPEAKVVLLVGSHARGETDRFSDVDLTAITEAGTGYRQRTWFEEINGTQTLVSLGVFSADVWKRIRGREESWGLGLPTRQRAVVLDEDSEFANAHDGLKPYDLESPRPSPRLIDVIEYCKKVQRARAAAAESTMRFNAQKLGQSVTSVLSGLNGSPVALTPEEALAYVLAFKNVPSGYLKNLKIILGLTDATDEQVHRSSVALTSDLLKFLQNAELSELSNDGILECLRDGTLERYVANQE